SALMPPGERLGTVPADRIVSTAPLKRLATVRRSHEIRSGRLLACNLGDDRRAAVEDPAGAEPLAALDERRAAIVGCQQKSSRLMLQSQDELMLGIGPIEGAPIAMAAALIPVRPRGAPVRTERQGRAIHQGSYHLLAAACRVEQPAARCLR